ncbi:MAG: glutathione S-transferase N-terminal domain-containing protein, partial [Pseudomonadales bacterium]
MRARMAVAKAGISYELREVLLRDKPAAMLDLSAKGTVPVLQVDDLVLDESLDIMLWALKQIGRAS